MDPTQPHPQRFEVYTLLPDKKGFMIKDCNFVFKLDRYGGWKDQNGHYYNANGQPDVQPEDAELSPQQGSINSDEDNYDDYDDYEPDYDNLDDGYEQTHNSWQIKNMERISKNMETLSTYPLGKNLRVFFSNMNYKTPPKSVYEAYSKKVTGIINIIFDLENNLRNGQGHFIMEDAKKAQILVKLQGQKIVQRQVHFEVESLSELIIDPIKQKDLIPFWNSKGGLKQKFSQKKQEIKDQKNKKEQVAKFKAAQVQTKKVEKKQIQKEVKKVEQKNIQLKELKVQQNKKQNKQINQYQTYQLNFSIFDTKTKFFNWFAQNGGKKDDDIKQIKKEEKDKVTKIFMTIKTSIVQKLNGKDYNGNKVKFTLVSH